MAVPRSRSAARHGRSLQVTGWESCRAAGPVVESISSRMAPDEYQVSRHSAQRGAARISNLADRLPSAAGTGRGIPRIRGLDPRVRATLPEPSQRSAGALGEPMDLDRDGGAGGCYRGSAGLLV